MSEMYNQNVAIDPAILDAIYDLNNPASQVDIKCIEGYTKQPLPQEFITFLKITDGLDTLEEIVFFSARQIARLSQRTRADIHPGYLAIGKQEREDQPDEYIMLELRDNAPVYCVTKQDFAKHKLTCIANSLGQLLIPLRGLSAQCGFPPDQAFIPSSTGVAIPNPNR